MNSAQLSVRMQRRHEITPPDQRFGAQRDRDRILYSSAFRRLAGITQIVRAGEADVFHTRQQHTLKVAQVGRRLAELLQRKHESLATESGLDPEVVEAACLAHDLGHPPFGHVGEHLLDELARDAGCDGGFEGNAQSFRILTKLAVRFDECAGLDLTRATLNATLKYPWLRQPDDRKRSKKWGAYASETDDFAFATHGFSDGERCIEAHLMDWADDIAYSVHDLEDFQRCGALPWTRIFAAKEAIINRAETAWFEAPPGASGLLRSAFRRLEQFLAEGFADLISTPYEGSRVQRQQLRTMTSQLISRYVQATSLLKSEAGQIYVTVPDNEQNEVKILKQITRDYIIGNPSLIGQQRGQEKIIRDLFSELLGATAATPDQNPVYPAFLPTRLRYLWDASECDKVRFVVDCIAGLTEGEALGLHRRLTGVSSGSVFDPIVR